MKKKREKIPPFIFLNLPPKLHVGAVESKEGEERKRTKDKVAAVQNEILFRVKKGEKASAPVYTIQSLSDDRPTGVVC